MSTQERNDTFRSLEAPSEGLYKEKGSKFLAFAYPVASEEEIKRLNEQAAGRGINFAGIMDFGATPVTGQLRRNATFSIRSNMYSSSFTSDYYTETISGFSDCGEQFLKDNGMEIVAGAYPTAENQVLIPFKRIEGM